MALLIRGSKDSHVVSHPYYANGQDGIYKTLCGAMFELVNMKRVKGKPTCKECAEMLFIMRHAQMMADQQG